MSHVPKPPNSLFLSVRVGVRDCCVDPHKPTLVLEVVIFSFWNLTPGCILLLCPLHQTLFTLWATLMWIIRIVYSSLTCLLVQGLVELQSQEEPRIYGYISFLPVEISEDSGEKAVSTSTCLLSRLHNWKQLILVLRLLFSTQVSPEQ